jgi:hypothetical protein
VIFARADVERGGTFSLPVDGHLDRTHHIENMGEIKICGFAESSKRPESFVHGCVVAQSWMSIHFIATPCPGQNLLAPSATPFRKLL